MRRFGYRFLVGLACLAFASGSVFADCDEVGYIATFEVRKGQEQAFEAAIVKAAAKVREVEEGTLFYFPYRGDNGKYYMMERYRDLAAREAHAKDPAVLELFEPALATLSAEVVVESVSLVCGEVAAL